MQSSFKILLALHEVLNVPLVTDEIPESEIFIGKPSKLLQGEFIAINTLTNPNQYLQNGFANVNIYVPKISEDRDNLSRFQQLTDILFPILKETTITTQSGTFHFQIDDDKGIFDDRDRDGMSYYNIRLEFQTL